MAASAAKVLSHLAVSPCLNGRNSGLPDTPGRSTGCPGAPGVSPTLGQPAGIPRPSHRMLSQRLAAIFRATESLAGELPVLLFEQPPPIELCQRLGYLMDWLEKLEIAAIDARSHVDLLWDLASEEATARRKAEET